jgi:hypothetical protein
MPTTMRENTMRVSERSKKDRSRLAEKLRGELATKDIVLSPTSYDFVKRVLDRGELLDAVGGSVLFKTDDQLPGGLRLRTALVNGVIGGSLDPNRPALLMEIVEDGEVPCFVVGTNTYEFKEEVIFDSADLRAICSKYLIRFVRGKK